MFFQLSVVSTQCCLINCHSTGYDTLRMECHSSCSSFIQHLYYDLPDKISQKYAYVDYLVIMHSARDWFLLEQILSKDLATISNYLQKWKLKFSMNKTMSAVIHLNNWEAHYELPIQVNGKSLPFHAKPIYFSITMDKALTYCQLYEITEQKANILCNTYEATGSFRLGSQ